MTQEKPASSRKHSPPLKSVQVGVQMRFTTGQMPATCSSTPPATRAAPATSSQRSGTRGASARSQRPAIRPRIIVPSVGMKLRVR